MLEERELGGSDPRQLVSSALTCEHVQGRRRNRLSGGGEHYLELIQGQEQHLFTIQENLITERALHRILKGPCLHGGQKLTLH